MSYYSGRYDHRDEAMAQAYLSGHYTLTEVGSHFNVSYATVSRAVKALEKNKMSNVRLDPITFRKQPHLKDIPIIAMTANMMASDKEKTKKAGMNAHVGKPFDVDEITKAMAKWIKPTE